MAESRKLKLKIAGAVQGVGFRPFVYRLARELELSGWVLNDGRGVFIEVEGPARLLETFRSRLESEYPPRAVIMDVTSTWEAAEGFADFSIRKSDESGRPTVVVLPDVATCSECLAEVVDATNRRYRYPFTNCTNCGPRFSIIETLPYDRPNTTMRRFVMCDACLAEYEEPMDRRFHAQPNACETCGPCILLMDRDGVRLGGGHDALTATVEALRAGRIVAFKGLGGFLLLVDASDESSVAELRRRKGRYEKPLAVMVRDLEMARSLCRVSALEAELLESPAAPILLLERRTDREDPSLAPGVAPDNPRLGVMLPYTPLHHLLLGEFGAPLIATSGNVSDEPICIDNEEALHRLGAIADLFLMHDRPIERHVDDSVVQLVDGAPQPIRRARGYAPLPVRHRTSLPTVLAVGGHLKNAAALSVGENVFLSQHIGDMETVQAQAAFERVIVDLLELYESEPVFIARDLHPDYPSSRWAEAAAGGALVGGHETLSRLAGLPLVSVQHHHAHLAACLAEHQVDRPALGVTWDGTGFGTDGTIWGGEFLVGDAGSYRRLAALRPFRLPGGDAAVREPRRAALSVLWEVGGEDALDRTDVDFSTRFSAEELRPLIGMLGSGFHSPLTTSAGRLFDAVSSLLGLRQRVAFEGQAAMLLEQAADPLEHRAYPLPVRRWGDSEKAGGVGEAGNRPEWMLDWKPLIEAVIEDSRHGRGVGMISASFHNALVEGILELARLSGERRVVLTGGCFQNRFLSERASERLRAAGFEVLQHRRVPANDGGLSLGQIVIAAARAGKDARGPQEPVGHEDRGVGRQLRR